MQFNGSLAVRNTSGWGLPGKTRITLWLDNEIIAGFRQLAGDKGVGYQTEINRALREVLSGERVTLEAIREIVRRELRASA